MDLPTPNNIEEEGQKISLLPKKSIDDTYEEGEDGIEIHEPAPIIEKRRGVWGNLMHWKKNGYKKERKESEALLSSDLDDDIGNWNIGGVGDIFTSDIAFKSRSNKGENPDTSYYEDDTNDDEDDREEKADDEMKERDLMCFTHVVTKDDSESSKSNSSPTSVSVDFNGNSDGSSEGNSDGSEDSSEDSSNGSEDSSKESSEDSSEDKSEDDENGDFIFKGRPTLKRRSLSTKSYFNDGEYSSNGLHTHISSSHSMRSGFNDNMEQDEDNCIDPKNRKRINDRIEGFGNSSTSLEDPSPRTFRERLKTFRNGGVGMKKMSIGKSSWTSNIENTVIDIVGTVLPPLPEEEGYMMAFHDTDTKPTSKKTNQTISESTSSTPDRGDVNNCIAGIERKLRLKDLELTSWKNRVKELEEEVNRLKRIINKNSYNNILVEDDTGIEWQT